MPSFSVLSQRIASVTIEYDAKGQRVRRTFPCPFAARRFFAAKSKAGRNPRVVGVVR